MSAGRATAPRTLGASREAAVLVAARLREMVVAGELPPGSELSQVELARMFGVSTTPVREALRLLEVEGLVQSRRNRRPRVPEFDPADLDAVYCHRVLLEPLALALSVPAMSEAKLSRLRADLEAMRAAAGAEDIAAWDRAHASFHTGLVDGVEPVLRDQIRVMMARADRYRRMSVLGDRPAAWQISEREHEAIAAACERGDADRAALLLARHLARSARSLIANLAPEWEPTALPAALATVEAARAVAGGATAPRRAAG